MFIFKNSEERAIACVVLDEDGFVGTVRGRATLISCTGRTFPRDRRGLNLALALGAMDRR